MAERPPRVRRWAAMAALGLLAGCGTKPPAPRSIATLTVAVPNGIGTIDPHLQDTLANFSILGNVYEPLVQTDAALQPKPDLAERWESPDPLTWVFSLRKGVRFHDGKPLDSGDVVYSLRRLLADPSLDTRVYLWNVDSVDALDPLTVRLRTKTPWPNLLTKVAQVFIVPAGATAFDLRHATRGTGPYRVTAWEPHGVVQLARFDGYWGGAPAVREAVLEPRDCSAISEKEQATARFAIVSAGCTEAAAGPSYRVARRPGLYVKYLAMDFVHARTTAHAANPFLDLRVRQAISLAVDRERLVQELGRPARAANQPVPLTVLGFDPTLAPFPADAGRARELLAQAGFPQGFEAPLLVRAVLRQGIERIQADLAAIGVRVRLSVIEDAAFGDAIARGESHLWLTRFACAGGDASDLFQAFFGSRHRLAAIHGGYDSPAMEKDFEALNRLEGVRARRDALQALLRRLMAELPIVPLYSDEDVYLIRQDVRWEPRNDAYLRLADVAAP